jgi:hypothetical protein
LQVATCIIQKKLANDDGLDYVFATTEHKFWKWYSKVLKSNVHLILRRNIQDFPTPFFKTRATTKNCFVVAQT